MQPPKSSFIGYHHVQKLSFIYWRIAFRSYSHVVNQVEDFFLSQILISAAFL